ncbi:GntR family transcriptional regulator [Streptomyces sp. SL13]|jgi:GntR family transcriptional regulator|uniref:GntR family transcriptional regulator n=1 Tax=Streptantibioticus silvisoli TaxID=2705255 RepID=A0AA90KJ22_9ACTN|nr:GntR family transcriptional regulator [Streptantibioticus silvisoli]MDI5973259.1 GntR family transcriptional regulator [Streptantibioticus silvisoli]
MLWNVDPAAREPLVEQIASSVRLALVRGQLAAGERLPSARELAEVLDVNANTVLAAYRVLREEEIVEFRRGRGVRVGPAVDAPAIARSAVVEAARTYLAEGLRHGWGVDELTDLLRELG